jgi:hypothetical protein
VGIGRRVRLEERRGMLLQGMVVGMEMGLRVVVEAEVEAGILMIRSG